MTEACLRAGNNKSWLTRMTVGRIILLSPCWGAAGMSEVSRPFSKYVYRMPWHEMSPAAAWHGPSVNIITERLRPREVTMLLLVSRHETLFTWLSVRSLQNGLIPIFCWITEIMSWCLFVHLNTLHGNQRKNCQCEKLGSLLSKCLFFWWLYPLLPVVSPQLTVGISWATVNSPTGREGTKPGPVCACAGSNNASTRARWGSGQS